MFVINPGRRGRHATEPCKATVKIKVCLQIVDFSALPETSDKSLAVV
jgi:hypothetical protein